eukprot:5264052-Prymnesium_polylepis.1
MCDRRHVQIARHVRNASQRRVESACQHGHAHTHAHAHHARARSALRARHRAPPPKTQAAAPVVVCRRCHMTRRLTTRGGGLTRQTRRTSSRWCGATPSTSASARWPCSSRRRARR